jgi:hypothetical protein
LPLPELDARATGEVLVNVPQLLSHGGVVSEWTVGHAEELSQATAEDLLAKSWINTLVQAAPTAAGRQREELSVWWPTWDPVAIGLADASATVPKQFLPSDSAAATAAGGGTGTTKVSLFWDEYLSQILHDSHSEPTAAEHAQRADAPSTGKWFRLDQSASAGDIQLRAKDDTHAPITLAQIAAAAGVLIVSVLLSGAGRLWFKSGHIWLAEYVWPLWLVLALALWVFLPVSWPALVVGFCAFIVLWRRYRELKRDRQFVLSPRALR